MRFNAFFAFADVIVTIGKKNETFKKDVLSSVYFMLKLDH